jgi:hypothetical protein
MNIEEKLMPRFEVIADYPFNQHFSVGEVIILNEIDEEETEPEKRRCVTQPSIYNRSSDSGDFTKFHEGYFYKYPHIFKKL